MRYAFYADQALIKIRLIMRIKAYKFQMNAYSAEFKFWIQASTTVVRSTSPQSKYKFRNPTTHNSSNIPYHSHHK